MKSNEDKAKMRKVVFTTLLAGGLASVSGMSYALHGNASSHEVVNAIEWDGNDFKYENKVDTKSNDDVVGEDSLK